MRNGQPTGTDGSMAKLAWGRTEQRLAELAIDVLGPAATSGLGLQPGGGPPDDHRRGTTEINLNIIGEMGLGLPREPKPA